MADIGITPRAGQLLITSRPPAVVRPGLTDSIYGIAVYGNTVYNDTSAEVGVVR